MFRLGLFGTLTTTQLTEIRRILGYPSMGVPVQASGAFATLFSYFRIVDPYMWLEVRMQSLTVDEEVAIFGQEHPQFGSYLVPALLTLTVQGSSPAVGTEFQVKVDGSLLTYVTLTGDTPAKISAAMAALITQDANAGSLVIANPESANILIYSRTQGAMGNGIQVQATSSDPSLTMQIGTQSGQVVYGVTAGGADPPGIQWTPAGGTVPIYGYVPAIRLLEADLVGARANLSTLKVDVIERRPTELLEREWLLNRWKRELADRLNVPLNPDMAHNKRRFSQRVR